MFHWRILASRLLPCLTFPFSLPAATSCICSESYHLFTAKIQIKPQFGFIQTKDTSSLVWTTGNFTCKFMEFWFGSNRKGETKQIRCRSKWMDLLHIWMNCVYIWDFRVISTILSSLDKYLSIHEPDFHICTYQKFRHKTWFSLQDFVSELKPSTITAPPPINTVVQST